jgi:hypothetical protein
LNELTNRACCATTTFDLFLKNVRVWGKLRIVQLLSEGVMANITITPLPRRYFSWLKNRAINVVY